MSVIRRLVVGSLLVIIPAVAGDWRVDLLKREGLGIRAEDLRLELERFETDPTELEKAYRALGSDSYPERVRAQTRLLSAGPEVSEWLRKQPKSSDPEVRIRVAGILNSLRFPEKAGPERMIRRAMTSLLEEAGGEPSPATGGMFYEWFGTSAGKLDGYRAFEFESAQGMRGEVSGGHVVLKGDRDGDGDQRLVLKAGKWPGREVFPKEFTVSAKMTGTEGGVARWHLGITIGKVRALFHPGYSGGGFRFEEVTSNGQITQNQSMGFTPSNKEWQRMQVEVRQLGGGDVELGVVVEQEGSERFETSARIAGHIIGKVDRISLDRSGGTGGHAMFDDLLIEFDE